MHTGTMTHEALAGETQLQGTFSAVVTSSNSREGISV